MKTQLNFRLLLFGALGLGLVDSVCGQNAALSDLPALRVAVTSVNESRNSQGRGAIIVNLSITGEALPPTTQVKQITVTKAEDNLGHLLGVSGSSASLGQMQMRSALSLATLVGGRGAAVPLSGQASFDASVRHAEKLRYIEGTIDLFLPSETNGSLIRVPNILSHPGRIEHPLLAKYGIEFYFLPDQATYDEAEQNIVGFRTPPRVPDYPNGAGYFLRDPSGLIADQQFQQADGTMIPMRGHSRSGGTGTMHLSAPLPADAQLVFRLMIPESIKTVPFRVEDVALP